MSALETKKISAEWHELEKKFSGLKTDLKHEIEVKREAIPLIFVPGIMGSVRVGQEQMGKAMGQTNCPT